MPRPPSSRRIRPPRAPAPRSSRGSRARRRPWCSRTTRPRSGRIETFANATTRWMVAVRMVSEGVDVPRLAVGVYATSASTPLFFAQAIGRFVRARRRGEAASVFLPNSSRAPRAGRRDGARARPRARPRAGDDDEARRHPARGGGARGKGIRRPRAGVLLSGARLRRALRSGALRRQGVRPARRAGHARGGGVPGASGPPRTRARARAAHAAPGAPGSAPAGARGPRGRRRDGRERRGRGRRMPPPRAVSTRACPRRCTARCANGVSCSTAWSGSTPGRAASRTAPCTRNSGSCAAGPRWPVRPSRSCRRASTCCAAACIPDRAMRRGARARDRSRPGALAVLRIPEMLAIGALRPARPTPSVAWDRPEESP